MIVSNTAARQRLTKRGDTRGLSSLPVALDCKTWWSEYGPKIVAEEGKAGWILFIMDAQERLIEETMLMARSIRNREKRGGEGWSQKEWLNIQETSLEAYEWYKRHCPAQNSVPEWADFILTAQYSLFSVLARMGRELRGVQELGYQTVSVESGAAGVLVEVA